MIEVYYFGVWERAGHFLHRPDGGYISAFQRNVVNYDTPLGQTYHIDGTLAPRRLSPRFGGGLWCPALWVTERERSRFEYNSAECEQGQFFRHLLSNGFTAIQWWDRNQGDPRAACNSTVLLRGDHPTPVLLAALEEHFPKVKANLDRAGVELVELEIPKRP